MGALRSWTAGLRPRPARRSGRDRRAGRRRAAADVALGVALAVSVASLDGEPVNRWEELFQSRQGGLLLLSLLLVAAAVALGRAHPHLSLLVTVVPVFAGLGRFSVAMMVMSYLAGRRLARVRPALVSYAAAVVAGTAFALANLGPNQWVNVGAGGSEWLNAVMSVVFFSVFPWLAGRSWRQYQELVHAGWERAELLEREQHSLVGQARLRERTRIAHDMHDSLGHELSLIALRAGAFEVDPDLTDSQRAAAGELRASATDAAARLREVIGVLRDDTDPAPLEPAGESITTLVARAGGAGLPVTLERGPAAATRPPMVDRAAYRVVQEALTNAARHAPGAAVTVRLTDEPDSTVVTVTNAPQPRGVPPDRVPAEPSGPARGHGLVGLRERVRLVGGTIQAEPRDGGFEVTARLPHAAAPAAPATAGGRTATAGGADRSESSDRLAHARQRLRRRVVAAVAVPAALAVAIGAVMLAVHLTNVFNSVLEPADYARLRVGQERAELAAVLPPDELADRLYNVGPPAPAGADCEYYGLDEDPLVFSGRDFYRLCFRDGRLVSKDFIPVDDG